MQRMVNQNFQSSSFRFKCIDPSQSREIVQQNKDDGKNVFYFGDRYTTTDGLKRHAELQEKNKQLIKSRNTNATVNKGRKIIAKHFLSCELEDLKTLKISYKYQRVIEAKMADFIQALEVIFPIKSKFNAIGKKIDQLKKNIFINEFLYGILDAEPIASN